ncbi:MAG: WD40 repeat domain-containing protein [archaeon]|nr:WD40 repeat domain-containing protein [archaeon]
MTSTPTQPSGACHSLTKKARCIEPVRAHPESNWFLVGSLGFTEDNEVHLLDLKGAAHGKDGQGKEVATVHEFAHKEEVWSIASSPTDPSLFFTCTPSAAVLWRMPSSPSSSADDGTLEETQRFSPAVVSEGTPSTTTSTTPAATTGPRWQQAVWSASGKSAVGVSALGMQTWDVETGSVLGLKETEGYFRRYYVARWDPHFECQVWCVDRTALRGWDTRGRREAYTLEGAHQQGARALDLNVNKPYHLVTGGDDSYLKFWDCRNLQGGPIKQIREAHTHWITNVSYHPHHDQLIISSGTDGIVKLWDFKSVSSAMPKAASGAHSLDDGTVNIEIQKLPPKDKKDGLIHEYQDHEESVYGLAWTCSESDAWVFGSISYDGRIAFNSVSQATQWGVLGIQGK